MTLIEPFRCTFPYSCWRGQTQSLLAKCISSVATTLALLLLVTVNAAAGADVVWVEDATPPGAGLGGSVETWSWVNASPSPYSGSAAHQSVVAAGLHQHYFQNAPLAGQLPVNTGDTLFAYVYLDPANLPSQIMLQWRRDSSWEQRAYWGANNINWGINGTNSRRYMGPLPPAGQWVRLEVPASQVGLEGKILNGMAFTLFDGRATWDRAGKVGGAGDNAPPIVSLTAPANGSSYTAPASITLTANASDSNGISKVEFYRGATLLGTDASAPYSWSLTNVEPGSYSYTARAYDSLNVSTTSAVVSVTVSAPNTPPTVSLTSPANGSTYTAPAAITLNATASDSNGIAKVEFYRGTILLGTDTTAPYSWALTNVEPGSYSYTAKAYDSLNASTSSTAVNITVSEGNTLPTVSLTAPANGSTYTAPASITLTANASDSNGISKVEFYNGTNLLGTDTTAPYSWALSNVAADSYSYTARAYDTLNAVTTSAVVSVTVSAPNTPPTVSLTAPANGSTYTAPAAITLNATASDSNGISKVEFYNGTNLLGTDTTAPYSWALTNVAAGSYSYTAKAYDTLNAVTTSTAVNVIVSAANVPPVVSLTSPANGSSYTAPAAITLNATASDSNGIAKVEFYRGTTLLGTDTSAPYSWALTNVAAGSYSYTAKAYDTLNAVTTSTAVNVTINAASVRTETVTYYHNDALGSPIAATNAAGALLWRETYRPYGERLNNAPGAVTNPLWYTGKRQDPETGLVYMGARYYNPMLGRFLSIDPIEPDENNLHSLNRYAYANNNPYKFTDPDGENPFLVLLFFGLAANDAATGDGPIGGGLSKAGAKAAGKLATHGEDVTTSVKHAADRGAAKAGEGAQKATKGETKFTSAGRRAHQQEPLPPGFERDVKVPGTRLRMDGYNRETKEIVELKPNNQRQVRRGEKQLEKYCNACDKSELGSGHTSRPVQTYDPSKYVGKP